MRARARARPHAAPRSARSAGSSFAASPGTVAVGRTPLLRHRKVGGIGRGIVSVAVVVAVRHPTCDEPHQPLQTSRFQSSRAARSTSRKAAAARARRARRARPRRLAAAREASVAAILLSRGAEAAADRRRPRATRETDVERAGRGAARAEDGARVEADNGDSAGLPSSSPQPRRDAHASIRGGWELATGKGLDLKGKSAKQGEALRDPPARSRGACRGVARRAPNAAPVDHVRGGAASGGHNAVASGSHEWRRRDGAARQTSSLRREGARPINHAPGFKRPATQGLGTAARCGRAHAHRDAGRGLGPRCAALRAVFPTGGAAAPRVIWGYYTDLIAISSAPPWGPHVRGVRAVGGAIDARLSPVAESPKARPRAACAMRRDARAQRPPTGFSSRRARGGRTKFDLGKLACPASTHPSNIRSMALVLASRPSVVRARPPPVASAARACRPSAGARLDEARLRQGWSIASPRGRPMRRVAARRVLPGRRLIAPPPSVAAPDSAKHVGGRLLRALACRRQPIGTAPRRSDRCSGESSTVSPDDRMLDELARERTRRGTCGQSRRSAKRFTT